jgi:hypothetical protein
MARRTARSAGREVDPGDTPPTPVIVVTVGVLLVGLLLFVGGLRGSISTAAFLLRAVRTDGTIVAFNHDDPAASPSDRYPVVRFLAADGQHDFTWELGDSSARVGDSVPVRYLPKDPSRAVIGDAQHLSGPLIGMGLGFVLLAMGVLSAVASGLVHVSVSGRNFGDVDPAALPPDIRARAEQGGQQILIAVRASPADLEFDFMWALGWTVGAVMVGTVALIAYSSGTEPFSAKLLVPMAAAATVVVIAIVAVVSFVRSCRERGWTILTSAGVLQTRGSHQRFVRWDQFDPERTIEVSGEDAKTVSLPLRTGEWNMAQGSASWTSEDIVIAGLKSPDAVVSMCRRLVGHAPRAGHGHHAAPAVPFTVAALPRALAALAQTEKVLFAVRSRRRVPLAQTAIAMGMAIAFTAVGAPLAYTEFTRATDPNTFLRVFTVVFLAVGVLGIVGNAIDLVRSGPYFLGTERELLTGRRKVTRFRWEAFAGDLQLTPGRNGGTVGLTLRQPPLTRFYMIGVPHATEIEAICRQRIDETSVSGTTSRS